MEVTTCDCPNTNCEAAPHSGSDRCTTPRVTSDDGKTFAESNPYTWNDAGAWVEIPAGLACPACDVANPSQRSKDLSGAENTDRDTSNAAFAHNLIPRTRGD